MSSHPNTLLIANIRPPLGDLEQFLGEDQGDITVGGVAYDVVVDENTDLGIYPESEHFAIYEYLTYGWGDAQELGSALAKIDEFKSVVEDYCQLNNCTARFVISANFC